MHHEHPDHPLKAILLNAARGRFPDADGVVAFVPPLADGIQAVVSFTGHSIIAGDVDADELLALGADGFGGATAPAVLTRIAGARRRVGMTDVLLVAPGTGRGVGALREVGDRIANPRVDYARSIRQEVRVFAADDGIVTIATGLAGVLEMSVEVHEERRSTGAGRQLIEGARGLVPSGAALFAAVTPGNARSLRSFLAAGFVPVGSVTLITPETPETPEPGEA